jgi:hypothetical protein
MGTKRTCLLRRFDVRFREVNRTCPNEGMKSANETLVV